MFRISLAANRLWLRSVTPFDCDDHFVPLVAIAASNVVRAASNISTHHKGKYLANPRSLSRASSQDE
jgi:hypothetical protein